MGDGVSKRKQKGFSRKKVLGFFIVLLCVLSIAVTIFYTIPQLRRYVTRQWYISPLANGFSLNTSSQEEMTEALVKQKLKKAGFQVKNGSESDASYTVILETGEKVIFSKNKPLDEQISSLQLVSSRFTIEGKHFVSLDLRFDRPVLVAK